MATLVHVDAVALEQGELAEIDTIFTIDTALIDEGRRIRPIDPVWASALGELMLREGQREAIDIARNPATGRWELHGAGGHRRAGASLAGVQAVKVKVHAWGEDAARLREIADTLQRRELDPIDRANFVAEAVACYKRVRGIDPTKDGRSASAQVRWQQRLQDEATDTTAIFAVAYGWSAQVGEQLGMSERSIRDLLLLARRLSTPVVDQLRAVRHPILSNGAQLRALATLEPIEQDQVVALLCRPNDPKALAQPAKSVSDALARLKGANRAPSDAAAKNLSAFIGAFSRMSVAEKKGALHELRELLPAGYELKFPEAAPTPAVAIRASVKPDYIACLECGERLTNLHLHLNTKHQMRFGDYLARWKLPCDYPAVAPYSIPDAELIAECDGDLSLILAIVNSWHGKPSKSVEDAVTGAGGTIKFANGTYELKLARVKATCTAGGLNLISAWKRAAEKRLEQAEALGLRGSKSSEASRLDRQPTKSGDAK